MVAAVDVPHMIMLYPIKFTDPSYNFKRFDPFIIKLEVDMENQSKDGIKELAEAVINDAFVDASEFITVPGNTVEKYVEGLIDNFVDISEMSKEQLELLKSLLLEAVNKEILESKK